jgi:hypothetical protein
MGFAEDNTFQYQCLLHEAGAMPGFIRSRDGFFLPRRDGFSPKAVHVGLLYKVAL